MNSVVVRFNPQDLFKFNIYTEKTLLLQKDMTKLALLRLLRNYLFLTFYRVMICFFKSFGNQKHMKIHLSRTKS